MITRLPGGDEAVYERHGKATLRCLPTPILTYPGHGGHFILTQEVKKSMDYTNWLTQSLIIGRKTKKAHYVPLLFELTSQHCHRCPPYGQAVQTLYENRKYDASSKIPMIPISLFKTENLKSIPDSEIFK